MRHEDYKKALMDTINAQYKAADKYWCKEREKDEFTTAARACFVDSNNEEDRLKNKIVELELLVETLRKNHRKAIDIKDASHQRVIAEYEEELKRYRGICIEHHADEKEWEAERKALLREIVRLTELVPVEVCEDRVSRFDVKED